MSCSFVEVNSVRVDVLHASSPLVLSPAIADVNWVDSNWVKLQNTCTATKISLAVQLHACAQRVRSVSESKVTHRWCI